MIMNGQSKNSPSKQETILWIEEKLETNTYILNNTEIQRNVSFDYLTKTLTIEESNYFVGTIKARLIVYIPLDKLNPSSVLINKGPDEWEVFRLILKTNNGSKDIRNTIHYYYNGQEKEAYTSEIIICIKKEALVDNLDIRLKDAFTHAIRLFGGTSKEVF
jgi:hypothetical protein